MAAAAVVVLGLVVIMNDGDHHDHDHDDDDDHHHHDCDDDRGDNDSPAMNRCQGCSVGLQESSMPGALGRGEGGGRGHRSNLLERWYALLEHDDSVVCNEAHPRQVHEIVLPEGQRFANPHSTHRAKARESAPNLVIHVTLGLTVHILPGLTRCVGTHLTPGLRNSGMGRSNRAMAWGGPYTIREGLLEVAARVDDDRIGLDDRHRHEEQTEYHRRDQERDLCIGAREK